MNISYRHINIFAPVKNYISFLIKKRYSSISEGWNSRFRVCEFVSPFCQKLQAVRYLHEKREHTGSRSRVLEGFMRFSTRISREERAVDIVAVVKPLFSRVYYLSCIFIIPLTRLLIRPICPFISPT